MQRLQSRCSSKPASRALTRGRLDGLQRAARIRGELLPLRQALLDHTVALDHRSEAVGGLHSQSVTTLRAMVDAFDVYALAYELDDVDSLNRANAAMTLAQQSWELWQTGWRLWSSRRRRVMRPQADKAVRTSSQASEGWAFELYEGPGTPPKWANVSRWHAQNVARSELVGYRQNGSREHARTMWTEAAW